MGVPAFQVRLRAVEDHAVMPARAAGDRVHMRVGQHLCPRAGVELAVDIGELLARMKVEMNLTVAEEVVNCVVCSCAKS